jgi:6-phosphofructokinase 1
MLVEVMGRSAGWIALASAVAGGADVALLPELPYRLENVVAKITERDAHGLGFTIVVVAEGARPEGGAPSEIEEEKPGHLARLGGAGARLQSALEATGIEHEVRLTVLGHLQRGGPPSARDRRLAAMLGVHAAELCRRGQFDRRLVVRGEEVDSVPLDGAEDLTKRVPLDGQLVQTALLFGIELGNQVPTHVPRRC